MLNAESPDVQPAGRHGFRTGVMAGFGDVDVCVAIHIHARCLFYRSIWGNDEGWIGDGLYWGRAGTLWPGGGNLWGDKISVDRDVI